LTFFILLAQVLTAATVNASDRDKKLGNILSEAGNKASEQKNNRFNLTIPRNFSDLELRKKQNHYWKLVNPLMSDNKTKLDTGEYRFKISLSSSISKFEGQFEITKNGEAYFIHSAASPDHKYIYVWASEHDKSTAAYQQEKLLRYCMSPINTPGIYTDPEYPKFGIEACQQLSKQNNAKAITQLGHFYRTGTSVKPDLKKAVKLLNKAFKLGDENAGIELVSLNAKNDRVDLKLMKKLSESGISFASTSLAINYMQGNRIKRDIKSAKIYANKAIVQGSPLAFSVMASIILMQSKFKPDNVEALAWIYARMRSFSEIDYKIGSFANSLEDEMSDAQIMQAKVRSSKIVQSLDAPYNAVFYIGNIYDNPDYRNKTLSIKVNNYSPLLKIKPREILKLTHLFSAAVKHRIEFYVDGEMEFYQELNFQKENSNKICMFYLEGETFESTLPFEETRLCSAKHENN